MRTRAGDIVVTQDYGVAAMALSRCAFAIHQDGWRQYTEANIDRLLAERHIVKKDWRASRKNHLKEPRKRADNDNERFVAELEGLLEDNHGN